MMKALATNATTISTNSKAISRTPMSSRIIGTARPTRTKMIELAQNPICSQVSVRPCHVLGRMVVRPIEPITRAAVTTAITPDTCR